ncbi:MAG: metallophosphoesterase family protein [Phycisphaerae bacterium]|nr:metallophosphoesterase family protein [Phycisphaerae bacterium]
MSHTVRPKAAFLTAIVSWCLLWEVSFGVQITAGPYLQCPGDSSMTIVWITDSNCTSWVEYGSGQTLDQKAIASHHGLIDAYQRIHKITLSGLKPGTEYRYRAVSKEVVVFEPYKITFGETAASEVSTFTTLDSRREAVSFVVLNDIHENNANLTGLMKIAAAQPFELVFLNGDILGHIEDETQIVEHVLRPCTDLFAARIPMVYVRGNHETRGKFARMLPDYVGLEEGRFYRSFDHGPVHFVVMDSGEDKADSDKEYYGLADFDQYRSEQQAWLEKEIRSEAFRKAAFRVALIHMPLYGSNDWHGPIDCQTKWGPLFNEGKLDLMISGHTHQYRILEPEEGKHGYPVVIGGGPKAKGAVVIRVEATKTTLNLTMTRDDGEVVGQYRVEK